MLVAAKDDYADLIFYTNIPYCLKDFLALGKIPSLSIFKAKPPVLNKWDTKDYNFLAYFI